MKRIILSVVLSLLFVGSAFATNVVERKAKLSDAQEEWVFEHKVKKGINSGNLGGFYWMFVNGSIYSLSHSDLRDNNGDHEWAREQIKKQVEFDIKLNNAVVKLVDFYVRNGMDPDTAAFIVEQTLNVNINLGEGE